MGLCLVKAGMLLLESLESARAGSRYSRYLRGFGCSCNAYQYGSPPDGRVPHNHADALRDARLSPRTLIPMHTEPVLR